ncbi:uncharacterized protein LOC108164182 [Drosophila miranda]|uniref:uncharacterized protein LOC108164182 n=1 Tax=Drosophila miranda TaxID=7229 RepID=UPI00143F3F64|nr:uncharacterized protein LOC108164182 [Drosophila miranda]
MESYFVVFLLCGLMCAVMAAPHPPAVLDPVSQELEEAAGSGDNSAEQYMNAMEERAKLWWQSITGATNGSDYSLDDYLWDDDGDVNQFLKIR